MSIHVNWHEWDSAEECLQWLFKNHKDMTLYGGLHVWQESFATLGGGNKAGSYKHLTPKTLENRNYKAFFVDDSVGICYYDQVFIKQVTNRSYPEKTHCVLARLPHN